MTPNIPLLIGSLVIMLGSLISAAFHLRRTAILRRELRETGVPNFGQAWRSLWRWRAHKGLPALMVFWIGFALLMHALLNVDSTAPRDLQRVLRQEKRDYDQSIALVVGVYVVLWVLGAGMAWRRDRVTTRKEERER